NGGFQEARLFSFRPTSELKDIHFRFDKYDLDERSRLILKQNADFLKQHPGVKVEIQGHCDERGTNNYNLALGQRRANSTKNFLASMGISENRLHIISYGEEKPFCMESSESCWWRNRRAHFMVAE
ncbi:MAG: peptidoglycan-associated lipoprotein Pal, partial [Nitrospinales bacterium]